MRSLLTHIADLRHHPDRRVRLTWWIVMALGVGMVISPESAGVLAIVAWLVLNLGLLLTGMVWGLLHLRALRPALQPAVVGSSVLALVSILLLGSSFVVAVSEQMPEVVTPATRAIVGVFLFLLLGVLWGAIYLYALLAASLGLLAGRWVKDPQASRYGVIAGWWVLLGGVLLQVVGQATGTVDALMAVAGGGFPALVVGLSRYFLRPGGSPDELADRTASSLARVLIRRWGPPGKERRLDLRGASLGLLTGTIGLVLALSPVLLPLQSRVLVALLQIRNGVPNLPLPGGDSPEGTLRARPFLPRVALLEFDLETRRTLATGSSESEVQAKVIRKLASYGARIVLPLPLLETEDPRVPVLFTEVAAGGFPSPTGADVERTRNNIDQLAEACRTAGSVVLAVPSPHVRVMDSAGELALNRLQQSVAAVGRGDLSSFGAPELPALSLAPEEFPLELARHPLARPVPPVPLLLAEGLDESGARAIRETNLTRIVRDRVLIDVRTTQPGRAFPRISYGSILREERLFASGADANEAGGRWESPQVFFRGRVVFLDTLAPRARDTVAGRMSQSEVLAHALATLQAGQTVRRAPGWLGSLLILAGAVLAGSVCTGRSPLQASRNAAGLCLLTFAACGLLFILTAGGLASLRAGMGGSPVWLDPVVPCLAILATTLLSANLTLSVERARREQNRSLLQRFVEPRIVEELLREMEHPGSEVGLGGTRQQVCVLFADVRGFTRFAESEPPEVVIEVTNRYLTALTEPLRRHGGLLDKYLGDGLMALFRVTDPTADLPRAVHAALAMRDAALAVSDEQAAQGKPVLTLGFGLHYGEAVVGLVGNPDQFNYTALGHTVVVAQRLQTLAAGGEVILSETVYPHVAAEIPADPGEPVAVKGLSQPVRFYRVVLTTETLRH